MNPSQTLSQQVAEELSHYYESNGLNPYNFYCKYYQNGKCPGDLARGMECHIGEKYGERIKVLIAALDCGNAGSDNIKGRTESIVKEANSPAHNPHMRGTYYALSLFLDEMAPNELVKYMVMINTCKCCHKEDPNHLGIDYYLNCGEYTIQEIVRIKPDVILFQGKNAPVFSSSKGYLQPIIIDGESEEEKVIRDYVRVFTDQETGFKCYAVICIHPSARGRSAKKRKVFYDEQLPIIARYIRTRLQ